MVSRLTEISHLDKTVGIVVGRGNNVSTMVGFIAELVNRGHIAGTMAGA